MRKKKTVVETWCPLTGQYTHLKHDHVIERARALWSRPGVEARHPDGHIISSLSFTGNAIEKARAIFDKWAALQQDPVYNGMLENKMQMALNTEVQDREEYLREILLWFKELDVSPAEVFSILAIYEARVSKNAAWPVELLAVCEKYSPDAVRGKKVLGAAREAGQMTAVILKEAAQIKKDSWQSRADVIWHVDSTHSKLNVARIIAKETGAPINTIRQGIEKPK